MSPLCPLWHRTKWVSNVVIQACKKHHCLTWLALLSRAFDSPAFPKCIKKVHVLVNNALQLALAVKVCTYGLFHSNSSNDPLMKLTTVLHGKRANCYNNSCKKAYKVSLFWVYASWQQTLVTVASLSELIWWTFLAMLINSIWWYTNDESLR